MAEDNKKKAPQQAGNEDKPKEPEQSETINFGKLTGGKFKSAEDLAKAYRELEKKLGEQGEEIKNSRQFAALVQPLLEEIKNDPQLFSELDSRLQRKTQFPDTKSQPKDKESKTQDETRNVLLDMQISRFEEKFGISKMDPEARAELRSKIGNKVLELTGKPFNSVDLQKLPKVLENAYALVKGKVADKSSPDVRSAEAGDEGGIPSVPSSTGKTEETLSPEAAEIAEKLGLTRKQYLEGQRNLAKTKK